MTDRIEAIRARHAARLRTRAAEPDPLLDEVVAELDDDMAVLLAELDKAKPTALREVADDAEAMEAVRRRIEDELIEWRDEGRFMARRNGFAVHNYDSTPNGTIRFGTEMGFSLGLRFLADRMEAAAPALVAPDAEPTEWEWNARDVVLDADGIAWQRDGERIHYPWLAVGQAVQRDQDITDLVTKHGGRVLVCKARGIGVGGAP